MSAGLIASNPKKFFGGEQKVEQPTAFSTLPAHSRLALEEATTQARALAQDPSQFAPAPLTPQQLQAVELLGQQPTPLTGEQFQQRLGMFQDPFEEQVVQSALGDLQRTAQGTLSDIGAGASAAGGFGGTRQAVLEARTLGELGREAGALSGRLRSQGFQQAADRALGRIGREEDIARRGALDLLGAGSLVQQQATAERQAPQQAAQFLANIGATSPFGGGGVSFREQQGLLQRAAAPTGQIISGLALL
jgi:hypothetical protein